MKLFRVTFEAYNTDFPEGWNEGFVFAVAETKEEALNTVINNVSPVSGSYGCTGKFRNHKAREEIVYGNNIPKQLSFTAIPESNNSQSIESEIIELIKTYEDTYDSIKNRSRRFFSKHAIGFFDGKESALKEVIEDLRSIYFNE